jgi:uncharacterized protein YkwD
LSDYRDNKRQNVASALNLPESGRQATDMINLPLVKLSTAKLAKLPLAKFSPQAVDRPMRRRLPHRFLLAAALAILGGIAQAAPTSPLPKPAGGDGAMAAIVSRYRMAEGLGAVRIDPVLSRAAKAQADAMAAKGVMSHEIAGEFGDRMRAAGLGRAHSAENLGLGYDTFAEAMEGWKASTGHRRNLLLAPATRIGIGRARGTDARTYWALILASPNLPQQLPGGPLFVPFGANLRLQP